MTTIVVPGEIALALPQACDLQKQDLEDCEARIKDLQDQMYREKLEADQKLLDTTKELEQRNRDLEENYTVISKELLMY